MREVLSGLVDVELRPQDGATLAQQLCNELRKVILDGALAPGRRLPSSRELARQLKVSRNTVSGVIDQLAMEGYLDVAQGRRPVVAAAKPRLLRGKSVSSALSGKVRMSHWAKGLQGIHWPPTDERVRPLQPCIADAREFPHELWARCLRRAARMTPLRGAQSLNRPSLQSALLRYLMEHRGVRAEPRQVFIMPSAQAAVELVARVVLDAGDLAWLESPGYSGARFAFEAAGARVAGVTLDQNGIAIGGRSDRPRLIFVTPSHQYPTGRLMSVNRRRELLAYAASVGATIIEDDYDSEFHYDGRPVAALQGLDETGCVFYVGTFSKSTFSDIRLGYVVVPDAYVDTFERAQRHSGHIAAVPMQEALAEFIEDGHFAAHIRRMTRLYGERRDHLVRALESAAGHRLSVVTPSGGMQLLAYLAQGGDDGDVAARLHAAGVTVRPLSRHYVGGIADHGLFLGFAAWTAREIDAGTEVIGEVLRKRPLRRASG
jgi:GntR family transcriptional regulator / MocR family aminotransferase